MRSERKAMIHRRTMIYGMGAICAGSLAAPVVRPSRAQATRKALRIMRWKNFVPAYETWFNDVFVREWGKVHETEVQVTNVGLGEIGQRAQSEIAAQQGHDLVLFLSPRPSLEDHTIDHRDLHIECEARFGKPYGFVKKSNINPITGRFHGFIESYAPTLITYRKDVWDAVGTKPSTWDDIRKAGRATKLLHNAPVGISLASEHNAEHSLRALMASFGASIQDEERQVVLNSPNTLEALKFAKALFEETMLPEVIKWTSPSNNQAMLSGSASLTIDTMSIIRAAESKRLPVEPNLAIAPLPEGPFRRAGPAYATNTYVIWKFASNIDGAQQFLLDYMGAFRDGLIESGFQNMPSFPGAVPDLEDLVASSSSAERYAALLDVPETLTNLGDPGHSNAATDEVLNERVISAMFSRVANGDMSPQEAMDVASATIKPIFDKWRDAGKI